MTARAVARHATEIRARGAAAWDAGGRLLSCAEPTDWRRRLWIEGYLLAVDDSHRASGANGFALFPVEHPRGEAQWTPLEDLALTVARRFALPDRVTAALCGRSAMATRIRAQRLGLARRRSDERERAAA